VVKSTHCTACCAWKASSTAQDSILNLVGSLLRPIKVAKYCN